MTSSTVTPSTLRVARSMPVAFRDTLRTISLCVMLAVVFTVSLSNSTNAQEVYVFGNEPFPTYVGRENWTGDQPRLAFEKVDAIPESQPEVITGDSPADRFITGHNECKECRPEYPCSDCRKKPCETCGEHANAGCDECDPCNECEARTFSCAGDCETSFIDSLFDGNRYGRKRPCGTLQSIVGGYGCCREYNWLDEHNLDLRGWITQGATWNPGNPVNDSNAPVGFNDEADYQLNQLYLIFEKRINPNQYDWDIGGRVDYLYGTDWVFVTADGLDIDTPRDSLRTLRSVRGNSRDKSSALPQLYGDLYIPAGNGITFRLGHFYTLLGYESAMATENFFQSLTYSKFYGEPMTHTGLLINYPIDEQWDIVFGITRGWDSFIDNNAQTSVTGRLHWACRPEETDLFFAFHAGKEDLLGNNYRVSYSLILAQELCNDVHYVFQHDFGWQEDAEINSSFGIDSAKWYSLINQVTWDACDTLSFGLRFEWFRDQDNARVLQVPISTFTNGGNYTDLSLGAKWTPHPCMEVRGELRWDYSDVSIPLLGIQAPYNNFEEKNQLLVGGSVTIRF